MIRANKKVLASINFFFTCSEEKAKVIVRNANPWAQKDVVDKL